MPLPLLGDELGVGAWRLGELDLAASPRQVERGQVAAREVVVQIARAEAEAGVGEGAHRMAVWSRFYLTAEPPDTRLATNRRVTDRFTRALIRRERRRAA